MMKISGENTSTMKELEYAFYKYDKNKLKVTESAAIEEEKFITDKDLDFIKHYKPSACNTEGVYNDDVKKTEKLHYDLTNLTKNRIEKWLKLSDKNLEYFYVAENGCQEDIAKVITDESRNESNVNTDNVVEDIWNISKENGISYRCGNGEIKRTRFLTAFLRDVQLPGCVEGTCIQWDSLKQVQNLSCYKSIEEHVEELWLLKKKNESLLITSNPENEKPLSDSTNQMKEEQWDPNHQSDHTCIMCKRIYDKGIKDIFSDQYETSELLGTDRITGVCSIKDTFPENFSVPGIDLDFLHGAFGDKTTVKTKDLSIDILDNVMNTSSECVPNDDATELNMFDTALSTTNTTFAINVDSRKTEANAKTTVNMSINQCTVNLLLLKLIHTWTKSGDESKNIELFNKLLDLDARMDFFNSWNPLVISCIRTKDTKIIELMLSTKSYPEGFDWYENPLSAAVRTKSINIVQLILEKLSMNSKDFLSPNQITGETALHLAVKLNLYDTVEYFIDLNKAEEETFTQFDKLTDKTGQNVGHLAAKHGDVEIFNLLDLEMTKNKGDKRHRTPLSIAIECGHIQFAESIYPQSVLKTMKCILYGDHEEGPSFLHMACKSNSLKTVQYLLKHGCEPNVVDHLHANKTPIFETLDIDILNVILPVSNMYAEENDSNMTAFQKIGMMGYPDLLNFTTTKRCNAIKAFAQHGANLDLLLPNGEILLSAIINEEYSMMINRRNRQVEVVYIPLHLRYIIKTLLQNGSNPNLLSKNHHYDVFKSIIKMHEDEESTWKERTTYDLFEMLCEHNITLDFFEQETTINHTTNEEYNFLQWAYEEFQMEYLALIIGMGCSLQSLKISDNYIQSLNRISDSVKKRSFVKYSVDQTRSILKRINSLDHQPRSLVTLAKISVKQTLGHCDPEAKINALPIPKMMKQFLSYKYIPSFFRDAQTKSLIS